MNRPMQESLQFRFPRSRRILRPSEFVAVYDHGHSVRRGPLLVHALGSGDTTRLGLSVSRKVGNAVTRNRVKRRLRDAFRRLQHELPAGYDLVVTVRPHDPMTQDQYDRALQDAAEALHTRWTANTPNPNR
tara:strand:+ start:14022 stop:14414 length:393 start_codon:yes stop_codon:yes gene_type:complete